MSEHNRRRLSTIFWHGLTGVAFAAVVALMFVHPVHAGAQVVVGSYSAR